MKTTINFTTQSVDTPLGVLTVKEHGIDLYERLNKAIDSDKISCIYIVCNHVTKRMIACCNRLLALRYPKCIAYDTKEQYRKLNKHIPTVRSNTTELYINGKYILHFDDLNAFSAERNDYYLFKEYNERAQECLNLLFQNRELLPYHRTGNLIEYLKAYVYNSHFDTALMSMSHTDKSHHTEYKGTQYDYDYTRRKLTYVQTLYDLLVAYVSIKWYVANGLTDELYDTRVQEKRDHLEYLRDCGVPEEDIQKVAEELDVEYSEHGEDIATTPVVVPFSACRKSVCSYVYSDYEY